MTEARTARLEFSLAQSTPVEVAIRGLDGVAIKESSSELVEGQRHWKVLLAESRRGTIRLAVDFQQPLDRPTGKEHVKDASATAEVTLPPVRALGVVYQSGLVAVEGSAQQDVCVETSLRKVDVGELAEADYQPGRRLLGAYGYGGDAAQVKVTIARPAGYELPMAIVERVELLTMLAASGRSQTAARFQMRAKALLIEVRLPENSTLWSAYLDGEPTLPQRESGSLLIGMPATAETRSRTLQIVYETPVAPLGMIGRLDLVAPKLFLRSARGAAADEVPLADLVWQLSAPGDFKVVRSSGTVFTGDIVRESPLLRVAKAVSSLMPSVQGAHEAGRRQAASSEEKAAPEAIDLDSAVMKDTSPAGRGSHSRPQRREAKGVPAAKETFDVGNAPIDPTELKAETLTIETAKDVLAASEKNSAARTRIPEKAQQSLWALEGLRSLPIELQPNGTETTFQSLAQSRSSWSHFSTLSGSACLVGAWGCSSCCGACC